MAWCIYAALHAVGIAIVWIFAIQIALGCGGTGQAWCVIGALVAAGIISAFIVGSFLLAWDRCRRGG